MTRVVTSHAGNRRGVLVLAKIGTHSVKEVVIDKRPSRAGEFRVVRENRHGTDWEHVLFRGEREGVLFFDLF